MQQPRHPRIGLPYLVLGCGILALSLSAMFVRWADAPGPITGFYRLAFASGILLPLVMLRRLRRPMGLNRSNILFPLLGGLFSAFDLGIWSASLAYTTAANATIIGNTAPLWVALASMFFFGRRFSRDFWFGLALALTGAALVVGADFLQHPRLGIGDLMALTASFFYAGFYLVTERGRETIDALPYTWLVAVCAAIGLFVINLALDNPFLGFSRETWVVFFSAALVSQVIGYFALSYSLGHLPASVVSPTMIGQPVMTTLLAIPLLGEIPGPLQAIGGVIALGGIFVVNRAHSRATRNLGVVAPELSAAPGADEDADDFDANRADTGVVK
jgi:drug/metabolite transporter (DMT)-like permease